MASDQQNSELVSNLCALAKQNKEKSEASEKVDIQGLIQYLVTELSDHYNVNHNSYEVSIKSYYGDYSHGVPASQFPDLYTKLQTQFPKCQFRFSLHYRTVWQGCGGNVKELFDGDIETMRKMKLTYDNREQFLFISGVTVLLPGIHF